MFLQLGDDARFVLCRERRSQEDGLEFGIPFEDGRKGLQCLGRGIESGGFGGCGVLFISISTDVVQRGRETCEGGGVGAVDAVESNWRFY
jgi:hypothetical protein